MSNEFPSQTESAASTDGHPVLDELMAQVGVDGLLAAMASPGLLAVVDQHAAAVRESLAAAGRPLGAVSLAGYATSVSAAATRMGHELPNPDTLDWPRAGWFVLRLVAVCALAIEAEDDWFRRV